MYLIGRICVSYSQDYSLCGNARGRAAHSLTLSCTVSVSPRARETYSQPYHLSAAPWALHLRRPVAFHPSYRRFLPLRFLPLHSASSPLFGTVPIERTALLAFHGGWSRTQSSMPSTTAVLIDGALHAGVPLARTGTAAPVLTEGRVRRALAQELLFSGMLGVPVGGERSGAEHDAGRQRGRGRIEPGLIPGVPHRPVALVPSIRRAGLGTRVIVLGHRIVPFVRACGYPHGANTLQESRDVWRV